MRTTDINYSVFERYGVIRTPRGWWRLNFHVRTERLLWCWRISGRQRIKRAFDVMASVLGLIALSPFFALTAVLVKIKDGGPVFVAQTRVGKFGREFEIYKFRRVGRWLRNWPLNDLPKLYNVLKGDLSLVGPRPAGPHEVALYTLADRRRLAVTPGLTGLWQIVGRNEPDFSRQVELDLQYIENQSFRTDLEILLKTIPAVLSGKGTC